MRRYRQFRPVVTGRRPRRPGGSVRAGPQGSRCKSGTVAPL